MLFNSITTFNIFVDYCAFEDIASKYVTTLAIVLTLLERINFSLLLLRLITFLRISLTLDRKDKYYEKLF